MRTITTAALATSLLALAGGVSAADGFGLPHVRVMPAGWYAGLDAEWQYTDGPSGGTHITSQEVNADDAHFSPMIDITIGVGSVDFDIGGYYFVTDGNTTLSRNMVFGKTQFNAGEAVTADATIADAYLGISYRVVDLPVAWLSIGAAAHIMSGEVEMNGPGKSETYSESKPMAAVTMRGGGNLVGTGLSAGVAVQWLSLEVSQATIDLLDIEIYAAWKPLPVVPLCIFAGYRTLDFSITIKDDEPKFLDVNMAGPYAGVGLIF